MTASSPPGSRFASRLNMIGLGLGVGLLNGLLGVGGGILLVPGLIFLRNASPRVAISTSLGAVFFLSPPALIVHVYISGFFFSLNGTLLLLAAGAIGAQLGGALLNRIPQHWILFIFSAFTQLSSIYLIAQGLGFVHSASLPAAPPPLWSYPLMGIFSGFMSGMLGIGGGGIVVLGYATLFNTPILGGLPLALGVNIVNAGSGIVVQWKTGRILWKEVARLVPSALVGIAVGIALVLVLPAEHLKILFALFFMYMGYRLFRKGIQK